MSFKSLAENSEEETFCKIINNFKRNESSDECFSIPPTPIHSAKLEKPILVLKTLNEMYKERIRKTKQIVQDPELLITVYEEWTNSLTKYCINLIDVLGELRKDACVQLDGLESKLNSSLFEISKQSNIKHDLCNLMELIRRAFKDDRAWDISGLKFKTVTLADIFGEDFEMGLCEFSDSESKQETKSDNVCNLTSRVEPKDKKMADIIRDNDLLKSEIAYLKKEIQRQKKK